MNSGCEFSPLHKLVKRGHVISCLTDLTMTGGSSDYTNYSDRIFCGMIPEGGLL